MATEAHNRQCAPTEPWATLPALPHEHGWPGSGLGPVSNAGHSQAPELHRVQGKDGTEVGKGSEKRYFPKHKAKPTCSQKKS